MLFGKNDNDKNNKKNKKKRMKANFRHFDKLAKEKMVCLSISDTSASMTEKPLYVFSEEQIKKSVRYNSEFRDEILSGKYFYYNGRFWLCSSEVLEKNGDEITISEKAKANPDLYCLGLTSRGLTRIALASVSEKITQERSIIPALSGEGLSVGVLGKRESGNIGYFYKVDAGKRITDLSRIGVVGLKPQIVISGRRKFETRLWGTHKRGLSKLPSLNDIAITVVDKDGRVLEVLNNGGKVEVKRTGVPPTTGRIEVPLKAGKRLVSPKIDTGKIKVEVITDTSKPTFSKGIARIILTRSLRDLDKTEHTARRPFSKHGKGNNGLAICPEFVGVEPVMPMLNADYGAGETGADSLFVLAKVAHQSSQAQGGGRNFGRKTPQSFTYRTVTKSTTNRIIERERLVSVENVAQYNKVESTIKRALKDEGIEDCSDNFRQIILELLDWDDNASEKPATFPEFFSKLIEERNLTLEDVKTLTGIPERTISRMKKDDSYKPSLEYIIIFCIALRVLPWDSVYLLLLAGYALRPHNPKENLYIRFILVLYSIGSVDVCDSILSAKDLPTLSSALNKNRKDIDKMADEDDEI